MGIIATNKGGGQRELIEPGNYIAVCYKMLWIGTVQEIILGKPKVLNKVRIGWELSNEMKVFKEENGPQPLVIDKEFTLSLHEKSSLRAMLKAWRGKDFTEKEAEAFDITVLVGKPCMLNIIHKPGKTDPTKTYQEIAGITPLARGVPKPTQINPSVILSYDNWNEELFEKQPDFIKDKMKGSIEYAAMKEPAKLQNITDEHLANENQEEEDNLPF